MTAFGEAASRGIIAAMHSHHWPWTLIFIELVKLLKVFGLIPGAFAAAGVRKLYQKRRQKRAMEGWPATDATIQSGNVRKEGMRSYWADLTYTYYVGEYRSGNYVRRFHRRELADDFVRQVKDKRIHVHYDGSNPDKSVILDRDVEMIAMLAPEFS
jgi:Protein of unknown function (DUF3592)